MKKLLTLAMACLMTPIAFAQNVLQVTDVSKPNDVYSSEGNRAVVVVKCNKSIPLSFESSMDKTATPYNTAVEGSDSVYYIEFPTGSRYRGRELSIMSPGYATVVLPLELKSKQAATFQAIDPNSMIDAGCYRGHRNKGVQELKSMNYNEARNQFTLACNCSDVDSVENNKNLALVDSIIFYRDKAEETYRLLDYKTAARYFDRVMELNPYDNFATNRYNSCITKFTSECDVTMRQADFYFNEKQYEKARELYMRSIKNDCPAKAQAQEQVNRIDLAMDQKKNHARVITYEYSKNAPIGFSYGKYNMHKSGGFFGMSINKSVLEMMRSNCKIPDTPELNLNFGWTLKIVNPVWVFFGPGATAKVYYGDYTVNDDQDDIYPDADGKPDDPNGILKPQEDGTTKKKKNSIYTADDTKANLSWALSPVVGLCVKYSYFAVRLTYQYRFAMNSNLKDFIGTSRLSVGVGVSF
mgnify:CR=1 FL=1